jgi:hypothetical protein
MVGFKQRSIQEHADTTWIVGTHNNENDARFDEISLSLKYGIPTCRSCRALGLRQGLRARRGIHLSASIGKSTPQAALRGS